MKWLMQHGRGKVEDEAVFTKASGKLVLCVEDEAVFTKASGKLVLCTCSSTQKNARKFNLSPGRDSVTQQKSPCPERGGDGAIQCSTENDSLDFPPKGNSIFPRGETGLNLSFGCLD